MGLTLQPADIVCIYTAAEILTEIETIKDQIAIARQSIRDKFSDGQAQQDVTRNTLSEYYKELAVWAKAYCLSIGSDSAYSSLTSIDYNNSVPRI